MKTRFDNYGVWITVMGEVKKVSDMDTNHILNQHSHSVQKPSRTVGMLIHDVENSEACILSALERSIHNITSMTMDELKPYIKRSPLFQSTCSEMAKRGVNVDNLMSILETCDSF